MSLFSYYLYFFLFFVLKCQNDAAVDVARLVTANGGRSHFLLVHGQRHLVLLQNLPEVLRKAEIISEKEILKYPLGLTYASRVYSTVPEMHEIAINVNEEQAILQALNESSRTLLVTSNPFYSPVFELRRGKRCIYAVEITHSNEREIIKLPEIFVQAFPVTDTPLLFSPSRPKKKQRLLSVVFIDGDDSSIVENMSHNIEASRSFDGFSWLFVDYSLNGRFITSIQPRHGVSILKYSHLPSSHRYAWMHIEIVNVFSNYLHIWLLNEHILLKNFNFRKFMAIWHDSFRPYKRPLLVHPLISGLTDALGIFDENLWNKSSSLAVEAGEVLMLAPAMDSEFLIWFSNFFFKPLMKFSTVNYFDFAELFRVAAKAFGSIFRFSFPMAIITASNTSVHLTEGYIPNKTNVNIEYLKNIYPLWSNDSGFRKIISPAIESSFARLMAGNHSYQFALHVSRLTNVNRDGSASNRSFHRYKMHLNAEKTLDMSKLCPNIISRNNEKTINETSFVLALYFPQFHKDVMNDLHWGDGYTDWDNILKKPSFNRYGHPVLEPSELGYYDLMDTNVRKAQACLAKRYGVDGFVYHHYWFYDPKVDVVPVLARPLLAMLLDGEPDLPFALNWANHDWINSWMGESKTELLQKQTYSVSNDSVKAHYKFLRQFFHHKNYIKVRSKPVFFLYDFPNKYIKFISQNLKLLEVFAKEDGFSGLHVSLRVSQETDPTHVMNGQPVTSYTYPRLLLKEERGFFDFSSAFFYPRTIPSRSQVPKMCTEGFKIKAVEARYFGLMTYFDRTPRRAFFEADIFKRSSSFPAGEFKLFVSDFANVLFAERCCQESSVRNSGGRFVLLNAWNEWGEGMTLEPNNIFGRMFLELVHRTRLFVENISCNISKVKNDSMDEASSTPFDVMDILSLLGEDYAFRIVDEASLSLML